LSGSHLSLHLWWRWITWEEKKVQ